MGVKVYSSLCEAPEVPSPEVDVPTGGAVTEAELEVGEAYENVSMLEFACLVHEHEQNMFNAVIATDFMEAVQEQVMLEADGDEAAADDAGEEKKSSAAMEKIKAAGSRAKDVAINIKNKIGELIKAFIEKLGAFVQKVRKKFGDLIKADQKIAQSFYKIDHNKLEADGWNPPSINFDLILGIYGPGGNDEVGKVVDTFENIEKEVRSFISKAMSNSNVDTINSAKDEAIKEMDQYMSSINKMLADLQSRGSETTKETKKVGVNAVNMAKFAKIAFSESNGSKAVEEIVAKQITAMKNEQAAVARLLVDDEVANVRANALNEVITKHISFCTNFNSKFTALTARAYADMRKYCLAAIAKTNRVDKADEKADTKAANKQEKKEAKLAKKVEKANEKVEKTNESVTIEEWAICEASDEYVFGALALI